MSDDLVHPGGGCVAAVQFGAKTSCIDGCIFPNGTSAPAALGTCERAMAQRARSNAPEVEKTWWIDGDRRGDCRGTTDMDTDTILADLLMLAIMAPCSPVEQERW